MRTSRALAKQIVNTYATVLFEAAQSGDVVDVVGTQFVGVLATVRAHSELRSALLDEEIPASARVGVLKSIFTDLEPALTTTLEVMLERDDFGEVSAVAEEYTRVAEQRRDMAVAEVTTAVPLSDELRDAITSKLAAELGKSVVLREKVDPSIIGGIVIDAAGRRIDASIVSQLEHTRVALSTTASVGGGV